MKSTIPPPLFSAGASYCQSSSPGVDRVRLMLLSVLTSNTSPGPVARSLNAAKMTPPVSNKTRPATSPLTSTARSPSARLQIVAPGVAEELKQEADVNNKSRAGISEEVKLTIGDDIEGKKLEEEQVDINVVEGEEEVWFLSVHERWGCKENFIAWEKCMKEAEKNVEDLVEKCYKVTASLMTCMESWLTTMNQS